MSDKQINIQYLKTNYGEFILGSFNAKLVLCDFRYRKMRPVVDNRICKGLNASFVEKNDKIIDKTILQLNQYFAGERKIFDIPLMTVGTDFQKSVWKSLIEIPYGKTSSYLELSQKLGNEKAIRAVASANGANAISIIIPCHRIIGSNGELTGYAGGLNVKKKLLQLEHANSDSGETNVFEQELF